MDQLDPAVTETEPKVDYKKLVDLLDGSDVVTNADAFDFRPSSTMILRSSTPP
jgi:RanBP-type and C3HC4-type zinc finger-containing protein 1